MHAVYHPISPSVRAHACMGMGVTLGALYAS